MCSDGEKETKWIAEIHSMSVADERTIEDESRKKVDGEFAVLNRPEKVSPENVTFEQKTWSKLREWTLWLPGDRVKKAAKEES